MCRFLLIWCFIVSLTCVAHVTFTNLICNLKTKGLGEFEFCRIKAVNRTHKYLSIRGKLYNKTIDSITANYKTMRKDNIYKLFFFDYNVDICKFLKNPKNPIYLSFYKLFRDRSNINHTCPFDHDIIVDKVWTGNLEKDFMAYLPIPNGEYAIFSTYYAYKVEWFTMNLFFRISN